MTYNPNGTFQANLNLLLSTLSNASRTKNFYNSTAGLDTSEAAFGHFMCRGDITGDACAQCVTESARGLLDVCPLQKDATVWYQRCLLRYANQSFFSVPGDPNYFVYIYVDQNVTDGDAFDQALGTAMDEIATQAANSRSGVKFAVEERNFNPFQKVFALAQCTPDLSTDDCDACLKDAISRIPSCCDRKTEGRIYFQSCFIRFGTNKFYSSSIAKTPPPAPLPNTATPPTAASTPPKIASTEGGGISIGFVVFAIVVAVVVSTVLFVLAFHFLKRRSKKRDDGATADANDGNDMSRAESLQYNLNQVQAATNNFSINHKIGEGGFGEVYKGTLPNGQEIAVKRLSRASVQGAEEFKNEIVLVANLQHRNLVRLLGFCFKGDERILIYEFVPNKSLDRFLFDPEKQAMLDWSRRQKIVEGIARGLLYLHEDSRLRIIHRDLKASNVLLDANMNPKIADFGTARIFGVDQSESRTSKIAGTFGYMSPEYVIHGQISVKLDVYSFGVLVLEIICGKRNSSVDHSDRTESLPSYAWKKWRDGTPLTLLDPALGDSYARNEVIRCIHIGLLCVQEEVEQRPTMASVVLMLNSHSVTLPTPRRPGFFTRSTTEGLPLKELQSDKSAELKRVSVNDASISEPHPR